MTEFGSTAKGWREEGVEFGDLRISPLLFEDDVIILASSVSDVPIALWKFAAECEVIDTPSLQLSFSARKEYNAHSGV